MSDDRDIVERLEDTNYDGALFLRREAAKDIRALRYYVARLEDELASAENKEGLLAYIVQLEKMFTKTDAENARLRADAVALQSVMERMREWESLVLRDRATVRAENARLREALERIANTSPDWRTVWFQDVARAALAEQEEK